MQVQRNNSTMRGVLYRHEGKSEGLKFKKPCLDCGALSFENRCPTHLSQFRARQAERYKSLDRREKKRNLYNSQYRKQSKPIRESATHCYLCGEMFTDRSQIQIDHVLPSLKSNSPLAPSHARCNSQKSDNDYNPNEWPRGEQIAKLYLGNIDRLRK